MSDQKHETTSDSGAGDEMLGSARPVDNPDLHIDRLRASTGQDASSGGAAVRSES